MMKIEDMKRRKKELGYTNADVAERSGVPLGTVQKVFSGATPNPRVDTMEALEMALKEPIPNVHSYNLETLGREVREEFAAYNEDPSYDEKGIYKVEAQVVNSWNHAESSERWQHQGQYTIEDCYAMPDDTRVELIDGVIYDMSSPSVVHQFFVGELFFQFKTCIRENKKPCEVFTAPFGVGLDLNDKTLVQPDVSVVCDSNLDFDAKYYNGIPELVVEVLSPSTRSKDCTIKLQKYMMAGVKEYWIVDPKYKRVLIYLFEEDVLPTQYSFDDTVPIGISGGKCSIDFKAINKNLDRWNR